jgi:hypothetical protein
MPVSGFVYEDRTLLPGDYAYYWISALDQYGNEGELVGPTLAYSCLPSESGWPVAVPEVQYPSPAIEDFLPEIPGLEVVVCTRDGGIYVITSSGEVADGWPVYLGGKATFWGSPALGDLDGDGLYEIVAAPRGKNRVYAFKNDGTYLQGWPTTISGGGSTGTSGTFGTPVISDLDGDGDLEVVVKTIKGKIYVWHGDGTGYLDTTALVFDPNESSWAESHPAVGDIDGDGLEEIVFGTRQGGLYAITPAGDVKPGFPLSGLGEIMGSVVLGDVEPDSLGLEIAFVGGDDLYLVDSDGHILPGWPKSGVGATVSMNNHPIIIDVDSDGDLEVLNRGVDKIYAFEKDGSTVSGFPISTGAGGGASITAFKRGDTTYLFTGDSVGYVHAYVVGVSGELGGFPVDLGYYQDMTPTFSDLDGDGKLELISETTLALLWLFQLDFVPTTVEWPCFRHDPQRTGNYHKALVTAQRISSKSIKRFSLRGPLPNPMLDEGSIFLVIPKKSRLEISLYDVSGRCVAQPYLGTLNPGSHVIRISPKDYRGLELPTGVYFLKVEVGDRTFVRKLLHFRRH